MKFPLGDILRIFVKPASWLGKVLKITKGSSIKIGDHEIGLNETHHIGRGPRRPGR